MAVFPPKVLEAEVGLLSQLVEGVLVGTGDHTHRIARFSPGTWCGGASLCQRGRTENGTGASTAPPDLMFGPQSRWRKTKDMLAHARFEVRREEMVLSTAACMKEHVIGNG